MNRTIVTVGSQTTSNAIPVDRLANPVSIGIGCVISAGAVLTYKVQYTYDDVQNSAVVPTWFDHSTITGKTISFDGSISVPIAAVRLNVTAFTSGTVTMTLLQARVC